MSGAGRRSAGLLLWREEPGGPQVLLGHPGGPLFARRDTGVWTIPKGEYEQAEEPLAAALREFAEELGVPPPDGERLDLGEVRLRSGKLVRAWATRGDLELARVRSNLFEMEWPPRSGRRQSFPELDRAGWFDLPAAREALAPGQLPLLDRFAALR